MKKIITGLMIILLPLAICSSISAEEIILFRKKIPTSGLVSYLKIDEGSGQVLKDRHVTDNDFTLGSTTNADTNDPTWATGYLTYDGVDNYCDQAVIASNVGTVKISTYAGQAFLWDSGQNFTPYVGQVNGNNPNKIVVEDIGKDIAWGFGGAISTGEVLGSDLFDPNRGTFDDGALGSWSTLAGGTNTIVAENQGAGNYALKLTCVDTAISGFNYLRQTKDLSSDLKVGALYKITIRSKVSAGSSVNFSVRYFFATVFTETDWTIKTAYFTCTESNADYMFFYNMAAGEIIWVDYLILQEVTNVAANQGISLYSTKTGTVQNMKETASLFSPNNPLTYTIRKSDFQITGALTVGCWVKGAAQILKAVISKYDYGNNNRGYLLATGNLTGSKLWVVLSQDGTLTNAKQYESSITAFDNTWHFVAFSWDGTTLSLYVDGVLDTSPTKATDTAITGIFDSYAPVSFGAFKSSTVAANFFAGRQACSFIYNRSFTSGEMYKQYLLTRKQMIRQGVSL